MEGHTLNPSIYRLPGSIAYARNILLGGWDYNGGGLQAMAVIEGKIFKLSTLLLNNCNSSFAVI